MQAFAVEQAGGNVTVTVTNVGDVDVTGPAERRKALRHEDEADTKMAQILALRFSTADLVEDLNAVGIGVRTITGTYRCYCK